MLGLPPPCSFLFAFQRPRPPLLNERTFWMTLYVLKSSVPGNNEMRLTFRQNATS